MKIAIRFSRVTACIGASVCLALSSVQADTVVTTDGSRLSGTVLGVEDGVLRLETSFAGTLAIELDSVASFTSEDPLYVRLASGVTMLGAVAPGNQPEAITVEGEDGRISAGLTQVQASWRPGDVDPAVEARRKALEKERRDWTFEASLDLNGQAGNSDRLATGSRLKAVLKGPDDELLLQGSYRYSEQDGKVTDDEAIGTVRYSSFFFDRLGWFVRQSVEVDESEDLRFRSVTGLGLTYKVIESEKQELAARLGAGYRYESFDDSTETTAPGAELALTHSYRGSKWWEVDSELLYTPSIEDFESYRISQDTGVEIPIAMRRDWKLRFGIANDFNSQPAPSNEELDTFYYTSLIFEWE